MALRPEMVAIHRGHPTAPGARDKHRARIGGPSPGNGQPGLPKPVIPPDSHGPGIPGHTTTGPMQPGAGIEEEEGRTTR